MRSYVRVYERKRMDYRSSDLSPLTDNFLTIERSTQLLASAPQHITVEVESGEGIEGVGWSLSRQVLLQTRDRGIVVAAYIRKDGCTMASFPLDLEFFKHKYLKYDLTSCTTRMRYEYKR